MNRCSRANRCQWKRRPAIRCSGGTVNGTGSFVMEAERVGEETVLAQIIEMVAQAQRSRAPIQGSPTKWRRGLCR